MKNETTQLALFSKPRANGRHEEAIHEGEERPGYQHVEHVGWIPQDWRAVPFGRVVASSQYGISESADIDGAIPMLRMNGIDDGEVILDDLVYVDLSAKDLEKHRIQPGELLFNRTNSYDLVGKSAVFEGEGDFVCASYIVRFSLREKDILPRYASYYFNTQIAQNRLKALATKAVSQANINPSILQKHFKVVLPTLPEQRKIARILGVWDRALTDLDALIEVKRRRKEGLAQRLLTGRLRLPGFEDKPWRRVRLTEVTRESRKRNDGSLGEDRLYGVTKAEGMIPNQDRIQVDDVSRYKIVRPKAFAYNPMRLNIGSIARLEEPFPVLVSPDYVVFECRPDQLDSDYLNHVRRSHEWHRFMERAGSGSVRVRIYFNHLRLMKLKLPSDVEEQRRIAAVLNAAAAEVAALEDRRDALARQKKGLMQRLLTGEIRVTPDAEDQQEAQE